LREDGTADIFGAGFDTFRVEYLPADVDLLIVARFLLMEDEETSIDLHVLGPGTEPLYASSYDIEAMPGPNHRPGYTVSQIEVVEVIAVPAETEGIYSVEAYPDSVRGDPTSDQRRHSIFFSVREGLPE
jgi:hypothetical protein